MDTLVQKKSGVEDGAAVLQVRNLTVHYNGQSVPALDNVSVDIPGGKLVAIVGPNGAGKSTFLKAAMGVSEVPVARYSKDVPDDRKPRILFWGQPLAEQRGRVSYMPQRATCDWDFPARVGDVAEMGVYAKWSLWQHVLRSFRPLRADERAAAHEALMKTGVSDFSGRQIGQLSGGQQQRTIMARSLSGDADLYLFDEPMAGVDAATEKAIFGIMQDLVKGGATVVAVHHDLTSVPEYFDHVLMINRSVIAEGPVATTFTAENGAATYGGPVNMGLSPA